MPPTAAHLRPPPEEESDAEMGIFRSKDRSQGQQSAPTAASLQGKAFTASIIQYLQGRIGPDLIRRREPYLKDSELAKLGIQVTKLDLTTGQAQPPVLYKDQFLVPVPPSQVAKWVDANAPKRREWMLDSGESLNNSRYGEARDVLFFFDDLLIGTQKTDRIGVSKAPPVLTAYTPWRWDRTTTKHLSRPNPKRQDNIPLWGLVFFYRPTLDRDVNDIWAHNLDADRPHLTATLAEDHKLLPGVALTSEVQIILLLACTFGARQMHSHHQLIPVTLLTCSWRTCRVVQGVVNLRTRRVELRISPNVDLEGGARKNWDKVLRLLGWLVAAPAGQTT